MLTNIQKEKVIKLRHDGLGYKRIVNKLKVKRGQVRHICLKNGLGGKRSKQVNQHGILEKREQKFKKDFEDKFPDFKYHSNFKSVDDYFKLQCKNCGSIQEKHAQCLRHSEEIICDNCNKTKSIIRAKQIIKAKRKIKINRKVKKEVEILKRIKRNHKYYIKCQKCCDMFFSSRINSVHCNTCISIIKSEEQKQRIKWKGKIIKCEECGKEFEMKSIRSKYCSDHCLNKAYYRRKEIERRGKLKENGRINYNITLEKLIERDNDICQICGETIDKSDYKTTDEGYFVVGDQYPSLDHIIPVSKDGTHTWDNVQLTHHYCNSVKRDKIIN